MQLILNYWLRICALDWAWSCWQPSWISSLNRKLLLHLRYVNCFSILSFDNTCGGFGLIDKNPMLVYLPIYTKGLIPLIIIAWLTPHQFWIALQGIHRGSCEPSLPGLWGHCCTVQLCWLWIISFAYTFVWQTSRRLKKLSWSGELTFMFVVAFEISKRVY